MSKKQSLTITLFVLLLAALTACSTPIAQAGGGSPVNVDPLQVVDGAQAPTRTLSVTGSGVVSLTPDIAYVTIGVRTEDPDAKTAVEANNQQTEDVVTVLKDFGIADEDIRTTNFNIYSYENYNDPFAEVPEQTYSVENSVNVTLRDISDLGDVLSEVVDAGANNIWGIQFDVADKSEAVSLARELAVENARANAEELAGFAEVELGDIMNISTYGGGYPEPFYGVGGGGAVAFDEALSVPVAPGQLNITIEVNMIFEIQ